MTDNNQLQIFESAQMDQQPSIHPNHPAASIQQPVQQMSQEQINYLKTHVTEELKVEMRALVGESLGQLHQELAQMANQMQNSFNAMETNLIQSVR
ncbi:hypothetical protein Ddc_10086 [Ditylenchus destructor]|nr:hypothetical protein Ddc_10086 [Ditylenchus destructor]